MNKIKEKEQSFMDSIDKYINRDRNIFEWIEEEILWRLERWFIIKPQDLCREIKWAYQRVVRGYDDPFVWNMHYNVSDIMSKSLDKFIYYRCGYPFDLTDEEWGVILKEMKAGFDAFILKDEIEFVDSRSYNREWKKLDKIQKKGMKLFVKYFDNLWD